MSNVNADATQLLTILKNMRTSISSIETTRSSVKMKYQQLGIGWNDKKYDELGTIVKDCNKALNDILQIMLQAEKYVASLAKSVQEYDNVNPYWITPKSELPKREDKEEESIAESTTDSAVKSTTDTYSSGS